MLRRWWLRSAGSCLVTLASLAIAVGLTRAQEADHDAGIDDTVELVAPELTAPSEAAYPPEALSQRLEAAVLLALTIDATGTVIEAEVLEPAGHGFDEAAREAALRFRFSPARRDGEAVAARIRYRYVFSLPAAPAGAVPLAPTIPVFTPQPAPSRPAASPPAAAAVEVSVQGKKSAAAELVHSAEAVSVINLRTAKQQTADLGEVLARTPGISVEREAGLGSNTRVSLAGLQGAQVKFFVDGIPLEQAGYPELADIPVNLIERVEIYRGVVPTRFGSDALGGAINVVTNRTSHSHVGASYQVGAFNTHRASIHGRYYDAERGLLAGGASYLDYTENSYEIDVSIPGRDGRPRPARVRRTHDDYRAVGGTVDVGLVDRPWARRLILTGFVNSLYKEYQSNANQTAPYGELRGSSYEYGATLRYEVDLAPSWSLELVLNYAHNHAHLIDLSEWVYDWYGERVRERRIGGERNARRKSDLRTWEDAIYGRAIVQWSISPEHVLRLSTSPSTPWRGGHEAVVIEEGQRDKGDGMRRMVSVVSGIEYEANGFDERLSNIAFFKHYWQHNTGENPLYFVPGDAWETRDTYTNRAGFGDSLRYRVTPWLYAKASYEYAVRLPEPEEYLGDGLMIGPNFGLKPEVSHNGNLGLRAELADLPFGELTVDVNGFARVTDELIMLLGGDEDDDEAAGDRQYHANVHSSRGLGIDSSFSYLSPGRYLALNGMLSWQDLRNTSDRGDYKPFEGERIPSRPWLFASWGARLSFADILFDRTRLEPFYNGRYVHSFNRSWDNYGDPRFKIVMPSQLTHSLGVTWLLSHEVTSLSVTLELDNFTDAVVYDFFGAQRAGRAFYAKITGDLR